MIFGLVENCPLCDRNSGYHRCHATGILPEHMVRETGIDEIEYAICECGLIFQWYAMTPETLAEYYKRQYREILGALEVKDWNIEQETTRANKIFEFINDKKNNVLDIGSSAGLLLKKLRDEYKCNVVGIEPCDTFRKYSQNLGLNILGKIEYLNENCRFDLITIIHVLEHCVEPVVLLEKAYGFMAENGKLIVEVPLLNYGLSHPIVFTEETFRAMLDTAGFEIRKLETGVFGLSDNISMIAEAHIDI